MIPSAPPTSNVVAVRAPRIVALEALTLPSYPTLNAAEALDAYGEPAKNAISPVIAD